jgi:hypothetical protein
MNHPGFGLAAARLFRCTAAEAAGGESDQAAEESPDAHRDTQRYERMPPNLDCRVSRAILRRVASGHDCASQVPHAFLNGCH